VNPVASGPLDPLGCCRGREVDHVGEHGSRNLGCELQESGAPLGPAVDPESSEPHAQVVGMLMSSRLASGDQPLGGVQLSRDATGRPTGERAGGPPEAPA
jgi:hypothetical protein